MGYPNGSCPKADGTTRSCGDYAVTVNPQLHVPQYPIPLPEDVFLKLRGGQRFTKLDLKINVASIQDDILFTGKDDDEHIKILDSVRSRLDHYGLRLHLSKCISCRNQLRNFSYRGKSRSHQTSTRP